MTASGSDPVPLDDPSTTVDPVESVSDLTPKEKEEAKKVGKQPRLTDKATRREFVRTLVALSVIGTTILLGLALAGAYLKEANNVKLAISGVFTPLLGVSGVIIGFYFGGKDSTN